MLTAANARADELVRAQEAEIERLRNVVTARDAVITAAEQSRAHAQRDLHLAQESQKEACTSHCCVPATLPGNVVKTAWTRCHLVDWSLPLLTSCFSTARKGGCVSHV
jgi:hypothetical protein